MITIEEVDDECYYLNKLNKAKSKIKRLQKQLKEANELIMWVVRTIPTGNQDEDDFDRYIEKWGVK